MRSYSLKPLLAAALPAANKTSAPPNTGDPFKDTSMLKPPTGAKVAIIEFEDLECPSCAHAYPTVHAAIDSKDDLQNFTRKWFTAHRRQMPFVIDPSGNCAKEVQADCGLGKRLGLLHTPTIVVVTAYRWVHVTDPT